MNVGQTKNPRQTSPTKQLIFDEVEDFAIATLVLGRQSIPIILRYTFVYRKRDILSTINYQSRLGGSCSSLFPTAHPYTLAPL